MPVSSVECRVSSVARRGGASNSDDLSPATRHLSPVTRRAFTLVEILVTVVLMSFIVLALMAVFNSTQAAFRASLTQTDVLEGGRSVMGLIKSDLESMTPTYLNETNFYAAVSNSFVQPLVGGSAMRANVMEDVFFITRDNQTWKGVGYFVRSNLFASGMVGTPGTLYRFETNNSAAQFAGNPHAMFVTYDLARQGFGVVSNTLPGGVSRLLDGVMDFKVRAFDTNGLWITTNLVVIHGVSTNANVWVGQTNSSTGYEPSFIYMLSNTLPASVEIELGLLEDRSLQRVESLGDSYLTQSNYLAQQAGKVHIFRQRIPIRNVDPSAYQ
ncbi:MAG: type II secretion system protein [Verrucomicrobiota bacterium]